MAKKPTANDALREDLIEFAAALYLHDHALIRAIHARNPGLDVMPAAASLFVEKKNSAIYEANIDSLRQRILLAVAGTPLAGLHFLCLSAAQKKSGFSHLASYAYESLLRGGHRASIVERTLDLLCELGWAPCPEALFEFSQQAIQAIHCSGLLWLAKRGLKLHSQPPEVGQFFRSAPAAFRDPSIKDLAILGKLCDLGALRDADGETGVTDFIAVNAYKAAEVLAFKGFKPRPTACGLVGINPVCSYINGLRHVFGHDAPSRRPSRSDQITATLEWMSANGADFSPTPISGSPDCFWSPFLAASSALSSGSHNAEGKPAQALRLFADLKRLGANPNTSGAFIHREIMRLHQINLDTVFFQAALDIGADPGLHPGPALAAMASWTRSAPVLEEWLGKLAAMGAIPSKASTSCPASDYPLAAAILNRKIPYANHLLRAGIDSSWKDSEQGSTVWHLLAQQGGSFSVPMMARLAKDPATLALIDTPALDGSTALNLACLALNTAQAKALLDAGASPTLQDAAGQSPLHCAGRKFGAKAMAKTSDLIALLMSRGADPALLNKKGLTAGQAMAKRSPLDGLAILLNARPGDLLGGSEQSLNTQNNLSRRGARAISIVESALLGSDREVSTPPSKAPKQRL